MNYEACESFMGFCDEMMIMRPANEGFLTNIKEGIRKVLLKIIRWLRSKLSGGKEGGFKSKLRNLLTRAEQCLDKNNKATTEQEVSQVNRESEDIKKKANELKSEEEKFKDSVKHAEKNGVSKDKVLHDKKDVDGYFTGKDGHQYKTEKDGKTYRVYNSKDIKNQDDFEKAMADPNGMLRFGK